MYRSVGRVLSSFSQALAPVPWTPGCIVWTTICCTRHRLLLPVPLLSLLCAEAAVAVL